MRTNMNSGTLIAELEENQIFVFGSNMNGNHSGGAALTAVKKFGAIMGQAEGLQGQSYAIPTLDGNMQKVSIIGVAKSLEQLNIFASENPEKELLVTLIGCGIAGFSIPEMKELFLQINWQTNVSLPLEFQNIEFIKGFDSNLQCKKFQFSVGETFFIENKKPLELCSSSVFHFCESLQQVHAFYNCNNETTNRYCVVSPIGEIIADGEKCGAKGIKIIRELSTAELKKLKGLERGNTGLFNSGNCNSGYRNSGNDNSGDRNSGNHNSGDRNSGNHNSGDRNSGDYNSGYYNSGDYNSGYYNSGYYNSGDRNSGNHNSGDYNSGDYNSGDYNSGYYNSGDYNSGDCNSGDCNSGDYNSGVFCTKQKEDSILIFDAPSSMSWDDWYNHPVRKLSNNLKNSEWISYDKMTDEEKKEYPKAYVTDGYLKVYKYKEAWKNLWGTFSDEQKSQYKTLPNWDADKFEFITGIRYE